MDASKSSELEEHSPPIDHNWRVNGTTQDPSVGTGSCVPRETGPGCILRYPWQTVSELEAAQQPGDGSDMEPLAYENDLNVSNSSTNNLSSSGEQQKLAILESRVNYYTQGAVMTIIIISITILWRKRVIHFGNSSRFRQLPLHLRGGGHVAEDETFYAWTPDERRTFTVHNTPAQPLPSSSNGIPTFSPLFGRCEETTVIPRAIMDVISSIIPTSPERRYNLRNQRSSVPPSSPLSTIDGDGPCLSCHAQPGNICNCDPSAFRRRKIQEHARFLYLRSLSRTSSFPANLFSNTASNQDVGVFTAHQILSGSVIGDVVGELIPRPTEVNYDWDERYTYLINNPEGEPLAFLDATRLGNWTRFLHHHCMEHNVEIRYSRVGQSRILAAFATRPINTGQQLRVHFGDGWFSLPLGATSGLRKIVRTCGCGDPQCEYTKVGRVFHVLQLTRGRNVILDSVERRIGPDGREESLVSLASSVGWVGDASFGARARSE